MDSRQEVRAGAEIDAVVTWVDGTDPRIAQLMQDSIRRGYADSPTRVPSSLGVQRFRDNGEVEFCIRGIRKMMPWIGNIYLVTASQVPAFLRDSSARGLGVTIVDHRTIFRELERALPTFNSLTIESALHRIPGVADQFIYFNDDLIPIAPSYPEDFFSNGKAVLRGKWKRLRHQGLALTLFHTVRLRILSRISKRDRSGHAQLQMRAAELAGVRRRYFSGAHAPYAIRKSTLSSFFAKHPGVLENNIRFKFRDLAQFNPGALANHLEICAGTHVEHAGDDSITVHFGNAEEISGALSLMRASQVKFICLQSLGCAPEQTRRDVLDFLRERIGQ